MGVLKKQRDRRLSANVVLYTAIPVQFGLHAFGDGLPVVDFGLIHCEQITKSPELLRTGDRPTVCVQLCVQTCRP